MGKLIFYIFFIVLTLYGNGANAQNDTLSSTGRVFLIKGTFTNFYLDNFSNLYLLSNNNKIIKYSATGDSLAVYNDTRRYGDIFSVDVTNPLKIILFYKDFLTVVVLDRFLNAIHTIDLRKLNIYQAKAVALSYDNNYWGFDQLNNTLIKIDDQGKLLLKTGDFRMIFNYSFNPGKIIDNNGQLYLYDENSGWMIFDYYGGFKKYIPAKNWENVMVINNTLFGFAFDRMYAMNTVTTLIKEISLNAAVPFIKALAFNNSLYVLKDEGMAIFALN